MNPIARKLTALSLAAVMGLGLAACGGNDDAGNTSTPDATGSAPATTKTNSPLGGFSR